MEISEGLDIAAYSSMTSQARILQGVEIQMLKKTLELQADQVIRMMEQSVNSGLGSNIDISI